MTILDRSIVPEIREINRFNIIESGNYTLDNQAPVYAINNGDQDILKLDFLFPAGNWYQQHPLVAFASNNLMPEGAAGYSASKIAELMDFYGAYTNFSVDKDNACVGILILKKYIHEVLPIFRDILTQPNFLESEIQIFRNKHKQIFEVEQSKVKNLARINLSRMLFGNQHPYGYVVESTDFDQLTADMLKSFFKEHYHISQSKIVVSGKINDQDIQILNRYFGSIPYQEASHQPPTYEISGSAEKKCFIEKQDALQSAIRIGKVFANKEHPDYIGLTLLNVILGGYFGSRLMKNIREEKGFTYGVNSLLVSFIRSGYLAITTEVGTEVTQAAIHEIYKELEILRTQLVPEDELQRVKNYLLGETVRMFDGPFAHSDSLISLLDYDLGYDYYYNFIDQIKRITSDEILLLAKKHLQEEDLFEVVVGAVPS